MERIYYDKVFIFRPFLEILGYGPQAIYYAIAQKGINPPPVRTIARVLKRHDLTQNKGLTPYILKGNRTVVWCQLFFPPSDNYFFRYS